MAANFPESGPSAKKYKLKIIEFELGISTISLILFGGKSFKSGPHDSPQIVFGVVRNPTPFIVRTRFCSSYVTSSLVANCLILSSLVLLIAPNSANPQILTPLPGVRLFDKERSIGEFEIASCSLV